MDRNEVLRNMLIFSDYQSKWHYRELGNDLTILSESKKMVKEYLLSLVIVSFIIISFVYIGYQYIKVSNKITQEYIEYSKIDKGVK